MPRLLLALLCIVTLAPGAGAQTLSSKERAIARRIPGQQAADFALLERVVNINSGTHNLDGVRAVGQAFGDEFRQLGFEEGDGPESVVAGDKTIYFVEGDPETGERPLLNHLALRGESYK